ncbi:MAG TPA: hypothetical protein VJ385_13080 [Fibrobacteria bacterium]|nr:hypothetical protein [Fibrobacteria bacterium]
MADAIPKRSLPRSIGAVSAGLLAIFILSMGVDGVLHATGVFPPIGQPMSDALFLLATAYRIVFDVAGCWLAARLAPDRPMRHAWALGILGFVFSIAGAAATWNKGPEFGPKWYPILLVLTVAPSAWAGGKLYLMQAAARGDTRGGK